MGLLRAPGYESPDGEAGYGIDLLSEVLAGFGDPLDVPGVDVDLLKDLDFGDYGKGGGAKKRRD